MSRLMEGILAVTVACGLLTLGRTKVIGQAPPASSAKSAGVFTVSVENMDRALACYHVVFGMDVPAMPPSGFAATESAPERSI